MTFDRNSWEERWSQALCEHGDKVARIPPNVHLTQTVADLRPGRALDAGCGHGSDTLWLAARGWQVTAVDFAATALANARSTAESVGADVAERIDWVEGDLAIPPAGSSSSPRTGRGPQPAPASTPSSACDASPELGECGGLSAAALCRERWPANRSLPRMPTVGRSSHQRRPLR